MDDDVNDFFDFSPASKFERHTISGGACGGRLLPKPEFEPKIPKREEIGTQYAEEPAKNEQELLMKVKCQLSIHSCAHTT
jgi:hypothetical protein